MKWGRGGLPRPLLRQTPVQLLRDLLQPLRPRRAAEAGEEVIPRDGVPAHLVSQLQATGDERLELLRRARQPLQQFSCDPRPLLTFDPLALGLADVEQLLRPQALLAQLRVIGHDRVRRFAARGLLDEPGATADVRVDADSAEADRLHLGDAERLVGALAE